MFGQLSYGRSVGLLRDCSRQSIFFGVINSKLLRKATIPYRLFELYGLLLYTPVRDSMASTFQI
jgi:hypothetical protein